MEEEKLRSRLEDEEWMRNGGAECSKKNGERRMEEKKLRRIEEKNGG